MTPLNATTTPCRTLVFMSRKMALTSGVLLLLLLLLLLLSAVAGP